MNASGEKIRILLSDDQRMFREHMRSQLAAEFEIVGETETGEATVELALRTKPHVIVLDIRMPGIGGLSAATQLAHQVPSAKVLLLSQYSDEAYVREAFHVSHVAGYVLKTDAAADLPSAIRAVHSGAKNHISPSIGPIVLDEMRRPASERAADGDGLTKRELEVIRLISQGSTTKEVASTLHISPKTAQVHRDNLKRKLNLHSTAAMVHYAIAHKLIRID